MDPKVRAEARERERSRARIAALIGVAVGLSVILRLRALRLPFILDDFLQMAMRTGHGWVARAPWDRFSLVSGSPGENAALVDVGRLPWWSDLGLRIAPMRPLSSLEGALGYALYGRNSVAAHAVSLCWLAALVFCASLLFRRALPARGAVIATFAYALSRTHGMTVAWIANRCALLSALFVALALLGWVRFREEGRTRFRTLSLASLVLALLSSEYALGAFGFFVAFELFRAEEPASRRARALVPPFSVLFAYTIAFRAFGYGARATALYGDPLAMPGRFAKLVVEGWPELVALGVAPLPGPAPSGAILAVSALHFVTFAVLLFRRSAGISEKRARWLFVGALIAALPVSVTVPQYRLLLVAELGFAASVGAVISDAASSARPFERLIVAWLGVVHLVAAPFGAVRDLDDLGVHDFFVQASLAAPLPPESGVDAVVLESSRIFTLHYPPLVRELAGLPTPRTWRVLSCTDTPVEVRRTGERELELRSLGRGLLDDPQARVYRDRLSSLPVQTSLASGGLTVSILETTEAGPSRIRFEFERSLDDPRVVLLVTSPAGFQRIFLPMGAPQMVIPGG